MNLERSAANLVLAVALGLGLAMGFLTSAGAAPPSRPLLAPGDPTPDPPANSHTVSPTTAVSISYNEAIDPGTVSTQTFAVFASQTGLLTQTYGVYGGTIFLTPTQALKPGELVRVSATTGTLSLIDRSAPISPTVWQFRAAALNGTGVLSDSSQRLGASYSVDVALGDLDGDGDLDAFVANDSEGNRVWLNDGSNSFVDSGQALGISRTRAVALGDLDGDGDLDALTGNISSQANHVWLNDGGGTFVDSGQSLGSVTTLALALGDLDGDGDLDAFAGNGGLWGSLPNTVWFNDGTGIFTDSGQMLGSSATNDLELGDVDGDGDLDALIGNTSSQENRVWINDGSGFFTDSGQAIGGDNTRDVATGDLDADGDLDMVIGNYSGPLWVWLNQGNGTYIQSGDTLSSSYIAAVSLGDLDGDGDLDAFTASNGQANRVWLNEGNGTFLDSGQELWDARSEGVALGDLDADGDLDAFVANGGEGDPNWIWLNNKHAPHAQDDHFGVPPNSSGNALDVLANDEDLDDDPLILTGLGMPSHGSATTNGDVVNYTPDGGFTGTDIFTYTVSDPGPVTDTATVTVSVSPGTPPTAQDDVATILEDTVITLNVLDNDSDPEGQTLILTDVGTPSSGTTEIDGDRIRYTPAQDYHGTDTFAYTVSDGWLTDTARVTLTISSVEDPPTINLTAEWTTHEDAATQSVPLTHVTSGAYNESQPLVVTAHAVVNPGLISDLSVSYTSPDETGSLHFTPAGDQFGNIQVEVSVNDGISQTTRFLWIHVNAINDPPIFTLPDSIAVLEDSGAQTVDISAVNYGPSNESDQRTMLSFEATSTNPSLIPHLIINYDNGPGQYTHGDLIFTPAENANGTATIVVTLTDGLSQTLHTLPITVTAVNDLPTLDPILNQTIDEDTSGYSVSLSGITTGADNEDQEIAVTATSADTVLLPHPQVTYTIPDSDGDLILTPSADRFGETTVHISVTDGLSATMRSFSVTVEAVNDSPTLGPLADIDLEEGGSAVMVPLDGITAGPYESQPLTLTATASNPALIPSVALTYTSPSPAGHVTLAPPESGFGVSSIAVTVTDGLAETTRAFEATVNPIFRLFSTTPGNGGQIHPQAPSTATLTRQIAADTIDDQTMRVHGNQTGHYSCDYEVSDIAYGALTFGRIGFAPPQGFKPGERIQVTLQEGAHSADGKPLLAPYVWQFRAATAAGLGIFDTAATYQVYPTSLVQQLNSYASFQPQSVLDSQAVALGDLDQDGDLDAYIVRNSARSTVWFNDGTGRFIDSKQSLGEARSWAVALGDVDSDGDLDALVGNYGDSDTLWLNDGSGTFTDSGQRLGTSDTYAVELGDLDGDGDLDAITGSDLGQPNTIWLNDGSGTYSPSGYALGYYNTRALALGDLDNDGDLDAFTGQAGGQPNRLWVNEGSGRFSDSGQRLGTADTHAVALGDLDTDGDLDVFVGNLNGEPDTVWINDRGTLTDSGQQLGGGATWAVALGDVNSDGHLDAFAGEVAYGLTDETGNRVWFNDGTGHFNDSGQRLGAYDSLSVALGDLDGDGDLDTLVGNSNGLWQPNVVYRNRTLSVLVDAGRGGSLSYGEGSTGETLVTIPAGAVQTPTEFRYATQPIAPTAAGATAFIGDPFALDAYRDGHGLPNLTLLKPMTLTLHYNDRVVEGLSEESLGVKLWNGKTWTAEGITSVKHDLAHNHLVVTAERTARYALMGERHHIIYLPLAIKER